MKCHTFQMQSTLDWSALSGRRDSPCLQATLLDTTSIEAKQGCRGVLPLALPFESALRNTKSRSNHDRLFVWLGRRFLNRTFSIQDDDQIVDVEEIRELLDEETKEADDE